MSLLSSAVKTFRNASLDLTRNKFKTIIDSFLSTSSNKLFLKASYGL